MEKATGGVRQLNASQAVGGTRINAAHRAGGGRACQARTGSGIGARGGAATATEGPMDTRQLVYNKLIAAGLKPHQALGAMYSLGGESSAGFNTGAYNPKDPGSPIGIAQWNRSSPPRARGFRPGARHVADRSGHASRLPRR